LSPLVPALAGGTKLWSETETLLMHNCWPKSKICFETCHVEPMQA
jgi:hypothetical protein